MIPAPNAVAQAAARTAQAQELRGLYLWMLESARAPRSPALLSDPLRRTKHPPFSFVDHEHNTQDPKQDLPVSRPVPRWHLPAENPFLSPALEIPAKQRAVSPVREK